MAEPRFLNVDLEIRSRADLAELAAEFGVGALVLHYGHIGDGYLLAVASARQWKTPDGAIHAICRLVEGLTAGSKRLWNSSERKTFDIGVEVDPSQGASAFSLRTGSVKRISRVGAAIAVTIYKKDDTEPTAPPDAFGTR